MHNPSRDAVTEMGGRMVFKFEGCTFFTKQSHSGNPNGSYVQLLSNKCCMYYNGYASLPNEYSDFEALANVDGLQPMIYSSDKGILVDTPCYDNGTGGFDMLSVSVHVTKDVQRQIMNVKVSAQLHGATLRHDPSVCSEAWETQLRDFLTVIASSSNRCSTSVLDVPRLHFDNCDFHYKPRHLPFYVIIAAKSFDLLEIQGSTSALSSRIIADEINLYFLHNTRPELDSRSLICVAETDQFEMSMSIDFITKRKTCVLGSTIYVTTCVDSAQALLSLIRYVGCNGDSSAAPSLFEVSGLNKEPVCQYLTTQTDIERLVEDAVMECPLVSGSYPQFKMRKEDFTEINLGIAEEFCDSMDDIDNDLRSFPVVNVFEVPDDFPEPDNSYLLQGSLIWKIYDGNDFQGAQENEDSFNSSYSSNYIPFDMINGITDASTSGDGESFSFESETFFSTGNESVAHSWKERGGINRNKQKSVEFHFKKIKLQHEKYSTGRYDSRVTVAVGSLEILDRLDTSEINKFLYGHSFQPQEHMLVVETLYSQPYAGQCSDECELKVSAKGLTLNVDQDTVLFLSSFFEKLRSPAPEKTPLDGEEDSGVHSSSDSLVNPTYFKSFTFTEDVVVRLSYMGKRVLLNQGVLSGLLMGVAELSGSELKLKRLSCHQGLLGCQKLVNYALDSWAADIWQNQVAGLLCGIGPINPVIQLVTGLKDLIWLPVEAICSEGHILRGLKRGAASFLAKSPAAALELTSKVMKATEDAAMVTCDMVSPGSRSDSQRRRVHYPNDIRDGATEAWKTIKEGLLKNFKDVAEVASAEQRYKGLHVAVASIVREVPTACVNSMICVAEASQIMAESARNHISPEAYRERKNKYKSDKERGRMV